MALNTLKHRNIAEVDRMFERLVSLVARFAFAIRQAAEIHRVLNRQSLDHRFRARGVRQDRVTDITVLWNHLAGVANVFAVVATKTS
jgi:hypothetical protein